MPSWLVVGLGNPGEEYSETRHNVGFMVVDEMARRLGASFRAKFHGQLAQHGDTVLLKPQTFMNRSGLSVGEAATFFKVPPEKCLIVSDDLDLPPGQLRLRLSGGSGGHNGLKSIIAALATEAFPRLRIGIGKSDVLGRISKAEKATYEESLKLAADAVELCLREGVEKAMNSVNRKKEDTSPPREKEDK